MRVVSNKVRLELFMHDKLALRLIGIVSLVVLLAVVVIYQLPKADHIPAFVPWLPRLNALINSTCTLLLLASITAIKRGHVALHKRLNLTAFVLSTLFLLSYVTFHTFGVETRYPADHPWRPVYLFILISHILLAMVVLPLVLVTFYRGLTGDVERHRRVAQWAFPIWLYVTSTGVIVYWMISPYYRF
jgi:putative membrane protein